MQAGNTPRTDDLYEGLDTPSISEQELQLQMLVEQGVITPEDAKAALAGRSEMDNISTDPRYKQAQMDALLGLQDISDGGMTAMDEANLNKIKSEEDASARGSREAILQNAQMRGLGGSGLELMSQMQNQQDSATRKSMRDMDVAAQSQQRALDAMIKSGDLSGQMQAQDFGQQAQMAGANDAISKFNAQNQQQANLVNTAARNNAQATNLQNRQNISNQNVGLKNQQQQYNKELIQKKFENEMAKRGARTGVMQRNNTNAGTDSQNQAQADNESIGMMMQAGAAIMSDARCKEEIEAFDPSEFLDNITSVKFRYKNPAYGEGEQYGTTAQDLEKSEVGSTMVSDTPEGKAINSTKATGPMLAALADMHKRLKKVEGA